MGLGLARTGSACSRRSAQKTLRTLIPRSEFCAVYSRSLPTAMLSGSPGTLKPRGALRSVAPRQGGHNPLDDTAIISQADPVHKSAVTNLGMPTTLPVGLRRRAGKANYGSHRANMSCEVESSLARNPEQLQETIRSGSRSARPCSAGQATDLPQPTLAYLLYLPTASTIRATRKPLLAPRVLCDQTPRYADRQFSGS